MKRYGILGALAFVVLASAAVWLGGLNQDEGWYLYAARMVDAGKIPYRDFAYTQGPLLPMVYSAFCGAWERFGLVGGRLVTLAMGLAGLVFAASLAGITAVEGRKRAAGVLAFLLLGCNLYHVYYLTIPKTYALAGLFIALGFYLMAYGLMKCRHRRSRKLMLFVSGLCLAMAAGARLSTGACLAVAGVALLAMRGRLGACWLWFGFGGALGLAVIYGPFIALPGFRDALVYHVSRGGFNPVVTVGSLSRLVRWYLPLFVLGGMAALGGARAPDSSAENEDVRKLLLWILFCSFLAVFVVQLFAPCPYEDYQVPVMALLAACVAAATVSSATANVPRIMLLALGMTWAGSFGSPLLQEWMTNGYDRFWPRMKAKSELRQLQDAAKLVESVDPGGKMLLTQDLYLAIEANRQVPHGLEMGPFSMLSDDEWRALLAETQCEVAALSGYTFAIEPPVCNERPIEKQMEYWGILKRRYDVVFREDAFGQHATPLLILKKKSGDVQGGTP